MANVDQKRSSPTLSSATARGISLAGLVLFALYGSTLAGALLPLQVLDPGWQLRLGITLINAAPLALSGLVLVHLAASLAPADAQLVARRRRIAALAIGAAMGFLLLVPLMSVAAIKQQQIKSSGRASQIAAAEDQLRALRQAVDNTSSGSDLSSRLGALKGPVLDAEDQALPLPLLKARVKTVLGRADAKLARERELVTTTNVWQLVPEMLRNAFAGLALSLGFAGLARRQEAPVSMLEELKRWNASTLRSIRQRRRLSRPN
jgi:hypothetical protein